MAGEQERKRRATLIAKALLLGYSIEPNTTGNGGLYVLRLPAGELYGSNKVVYGMTNPLTFRVMWHAAREALKLSGVPDATDIPRNTGAGSGKNWKVRHRRGLRGGSKSLFEGDGTS